jgi:predicted dehydrogenase
MKTYHCGKSYPSLEEMVKDRNIDAIAVFTEGPNHVRHTIECMKHGKHVISAVPACWGSLEEVEKLLETVKKYGLTYMMAETSYYQQFVISVRKMFESGDFGNLYYCESEYQHDGLEVLYMENGKKTWRYGVAPMHYPTHCTAHITGITGERLTEVVCHGWGDDSTYLKDNVYNNPFHNESAFFKTDKGNSFRANIWWKGAHLGGERANWIGSGMSFYADNGRSGPALIKKTRKMGTDDAGFVQSRPELEIYDQPEWWNTDMLPEPLRHNSGHHGSHTFLTHEFIDALLNERNPTVDIYEALAYTVPGIVAHESALRGGELLKIPQFHG